MREFLLPYGKETLKAEIEEEHLAGVLVSELHDYKARWSIPSGLPGYVIWPLTRKRLW